MMELGIQVRGDWEFLLSVLKWSETHEIAILALPDHYLQRGDRPGNPAWDHLTHLAGLAAMSSTIQLASLVSPVSFRHPAVLYKMGVTIDEISGGRFTLGLGAGWMDEEFELFGFPYPSMRERADQLEEQMAYIRAAMTPGGGGYQGKHYTLADFDPKPDPINLRLMAGGAGGPRSREMTARYGDEYNVYGTTPERFSEVREKTRFLATGFGRDPDEILWSSAGPALAAGKEADYRGLLSKMSALTGQDTARIERVYEERGFPHGSGGKASEMMAALEEAGCQRYYLQFFSIGPEDFDTVVDAYRV